MTAASTEDDPFLTVAEISAMMRVSKMTVYRLIHEQEIETVRIGRAFRVRESQVHRYMTRMTSPAVLP